MSSFSEIRIEQYRGIKDLNISGLGRVNLVVGDNNCGKTSVLEAIRLFQLPGSLYYVYRVARQRESIISMAANTAYESFVCMFPHADALRISGSGVLNGRSVSYQLTGEQHRVLLDTKQMDRLVRIELEQNESEIETDVFEGKLEYSCGDYSHTEEINVNRLTGFGNPKVPPMQNQPIVYLAPFEHLRGDAISVIVKNEGYKQICIRALQLFDPDIEDIMIYKSDTGNRAVEYLRHKRLGDMPLSTFGDGIKKVLALANAVAKSAGGILLIDEIETSIHKKYYDDIFRFIVKACEQFDVQVFITTHSIEAIDGLLATQDYNLQDSKDLIRVVTLRQTEDRTYSRLMPGRDVVNNREAFGFEVRL